MKDRPRDTIAPESRTHKQIFQIKTRPPQEGGEIVEIECEARWLTIPFRHDGVSFFVFEQKMVEQRRIGDAFLLQAFEHRQFANEL